MQPPRVTVVIPTLTADMPLWESIESLRGQTYRNLRIVIVDNSGCEKVAASWPASIPRDGVTILHPGSNIGFGAAVN
ncbi:MAG: glycosyltransferase, partial [Acidobacteria bacterium]|nr:glycosyltransferase [Acidobacteriota bacterium]